MAEYKIVIRKKYEGMSPEFDKKISKTRAKRFMTKKAAEKFGNKRHGEDFRGIIWRIKKVK